jgi:hypothetical protein
MGAFLHYHVCWVGDRDFRDQIPTHFVELVADVDSIRLESIRLAVVVTVTS